MAWGLQPNFRFPSPAPDAKKALAGLFYWVLKYSDQRHAGFGLQRFTRHAGRQFNHLQAQRRYVHHRQVGDDAVHHAHAGQRQRASRQNFQVHGAVFLFGDMLHQHDHALDAGDQVHRAAHALDHLARNHPVGQVALLADLHRAQDGQVDLAAANHRKAVMTAEDRRTRQRGHGLLAGVDQVGVHRIFSRERADAQHAILGLQPDFLVAGNEVGNQRRNADAEVDVETVFEFLGSSGRHLVLGPRHAFRLLVGRWRP